MLVAYQLHLCNEIGTIGCISAVWGERVGMAGSLGPTDAVVEIRDRGSLSEIAAEWDCATIEFLTCATPWRTFRWRAGQFHYSGTYWCATNRDHVIYESRLELARLLFADYDRTVTQVLAQPFLLRARAKGRPRRHVPDYLLFTDGIPTVVDVKPADKLSVEKVRFTLDWTRELVEDRGWIYEVWTEPDDFSLRNLRFLAGFRNPDRFNDALLKRIVQQSSSCESLGEVLDLDVGEPPARVRAAVLHLVWRQILAVDVSQPLTRSSHVVKGI